VLKFNYLVRSPARQWSLADPKIAQIPDRGCSLSRGIGKSGVDFR
jgi:hypothetical protein